LVGGGRESSGEVGGGRERLGRLVVAEAERDGFKLVVVEAEIDWGKSVAAEGDRGKLVGDI
jgi:hypothetical protein